MLERSSYLQDMLKRFGALQRAWPGLLALSLAILWLPEAGRGASIESTTYDHGVKAAVAGQWEASARLMLQAMTTEPNEKKTLMAGFYLPHYYLGLSLYQLGDCELAAEHFAKSRQDGIVYGTKYIARLRRIQDACNDRSRSQRQVQRDIDAARRELERVAARTDEPRLAGFWGQHTPPAPSQQLEEARQALERAQQSLERQISLRQVDGTERMIRAVGDDDIAGAAESTARAIEILKYLDASTDRYSATPDPSREALLDEILALRMQAVRVWSESSRPEIEASMSRHLSNELQRVTRLHLGDDEATLNQLVATRTELTTFIEAVSKLPSRRAPNPPLAVPSALRKAAAALFNGKYEDVLAVLADVELEDRRDLAHSYLFRAAALYSLYLIAAEPDPVLLSKVELSLASYLDTGVDLEPTTETFSPRFIHFFEQQASLVSKGRDSIGLRTEPAKERHLVVPRN